MSGADKLAWYARRLASMSPPEVAHRVVERTKQFVDARRSWSWESFDADIQFAPLPGFSLERAIAGLTPEVERHARAVHAGDIRFLSAQWPRQNSRKWWRSGIWTLDPISGQHWPGKGAPASKSAYRNATGFGDIKFAWELNRLQFLMPLAVAARRDGDDALAADIADIMAAWMEENPPYEGVNWTNGIEAATRIVVALFINTVLPEHAPPRLAAFVAAHAWILARYPSLFSSANNHRVAELCALRLAHLCAGDLPAAAEGGAHARGELEREILVQFCEDGVGAEQSPTYAAYSLEWFLLTAACSDAAGEPVSGASRERLRDAARHLRWMMDAAGCTPAIGDDDEGRVCALGPETDFLYSAAICGAAGQWLSDPASTPPSQPPTLLGAFTPGQPQVAAQPVGRRTFAQGGYTVWRKDDALLAFDHGPLGFLSIAAHGHADALALWLHLGAEPAIIDAATYLYHTHNGARDRFRGTAAHNTLCLDGRDQSRIAGPFNWADHAKAVLREAAELTATAAHDGYIASHGVAHVRRVAFDKTEITVDDELEGALKQPAEWRHGFTFNSAAKVAATSEGCVVTLSSGRAFRVAIAGADRLTLEDVEVSTGFGRLAAAKRLVAAGRATNTGALTRTIVQLS
ncbi:MAG: alginate lyase family protein [Hyphomonadaceae bacterium]